MAALRFVSAAAGMPVKVVDGERWNVKVTVKDDLEIVMSFLSGTGLEFSSPDGN